MRNPVKTAKRQLLRVGSCALSALMVLGSIPAAAIGDGVTATYDEAYYAMTDYYGNLTDGSVVKSYRTNGIATLTDYGDYDEIINLTKREYELLLILMENINVVMSRKELLSKVWGYDSKVETNVVDVYIRYLRNKIDRPGEKSYIQTVRGTGYVIRS